MLCPQCGGDLATTTARCPQCKSLLMKVTQSTIDASQETSGLAVDQGLPDVSAGTVGGINLDNVSGPKAEGSFTPRVEYQPKFEPVKRWAYRDIDHYEVLGLDFNSQGEEVEARVELLKRALVRWSEDQLDKVAQDVGSEGQNRLPELEADLLHNRDGYNERLRAEQHQAAILGVRKEVESAAVDGVIQWSEWIGLKEKTRALGVASDELEEILGTFRSRGVVTGLSLPGLGGEVRTLIELKDVCSENPSFIVDPLWEGQLEDWLMRAAMKPQLAEFVSQIKQEYSEAKLSGVWLFLWVIGERKLVLEKAGGSAEVLTVESWAQGIESGELRQPSIEALRDLRLENWLAKAMGREDLAHLVQQLREDGEEDLTRIVRVIRASGTEAIFEWQDGSCAYSIGELATQCETKVGEVGIYLFNKTFETRFKALGKAGLATSTDTVRRKYKDVPRRAVEMFIRELCKAAKMNPYPMLVIQPTIEFSRVKFGHVQTKAIQIENRARGYAWGRIAIQNEAPGIKVQEAFDLHEGNTIEIKLDTSGVSVGKYQSNFIIEAEGLAEMQPILVSYEVVPLDLTIQPEAMQLGRLPQGAKTRKSLRLSNGDKGQSTGEVWLESEIRGVTFTKHLKIDSRSTADIEVQIDTLTVQPGKYASNLVIEGHGFPGVFKVPLTLEVLPLEIKLDPVELSLGKLMHGTKREANIAVSCAPSGGRLVGNQRGFEPGVNGLSATGKLDGQQGDVHVTIDTSKLPPGKRFNTSLILETNAGKLNIPVKFKTSDLPDQVIVWNAIGFGLAVGLVMYLSRVLLQYVEGLDSWFFSYQSGTTVIIGTGAFGALLVTIGVLAFRHSRLVTSIVRQLRSTKTTTAKFVKELDEGDSVHGLGLDERSETVNPIGRDELHSKILGLSDEQLLKMLHVDFRDYRKEALSFAETEVKRRGLESRAVKNVNNDSV